MTIGSALPTTCTADFLHVVLDALGHVEVDDTFELLKVQAHTQSHCRHYDPHLSPSELLQRICLLLAGKGGMVHGYWHADRVADVVEDFVHDLSGTSVDQYPLAFAYQWVI